MEQVQHIYNDLRDNDEIAIIEKYGDYAKKYTVGFTSKMTFVVFYFFLLEFLLNLLLSFSKI